METEEPSLPAIHFIVWLGRVAPVQRHKSDENANNGHYKNCPVDPLWLPGVPTSLLCVMA
ncbi:MAG: hypothetical protein QOI49_2015 [Verrucomicrobiota bacterium]